MKYSVQCISTILHLWLFDSQLSQLRVGEVQEPPGPMLEGGAEPVEAPVGDPPIQVAMPDDLRVSIRCWLLFYLRVSDLIRVLSHGLGPQLAIVFNCNNSFKSKK